MKNIHVLPTNNQYKGSISLRPDGKLSTNVLLGIPQNIYITSDEELKGYGEVVFDIKNNKVVKWEHPIATTTPYFKKIILTTDPSLAPDVRKIDDDFLEWFVNNPSCEEVEVNWVKIPDGIFYHKDNVPYGYYKIIIPKEEPKQDLPIVNGSYGCTIQTKKQEPKQETLEQIDQNNPVTRGSTALVYKQETVEEAAEKHADNQSDTSMRSNPLEFSKSGEELWKESKEDFIEGAKWQQERSYSKEEVLDILNLHTSYLETFICQYIDKQDMEVNGEWFKQFKKK